MGRNTLKLDMKGFDEYLTKLDKLGADLKPIITDALSEVGETIGDDTLDAVDKSNLPAGGEYSKGDTEKSVILSPEVEWIGTVAEIGVGFDYGKPGAGGYLITGTPRMAPDRALNRMYKGRKYMSQIKNDIKDILVDEMERRMT